MSNLFSIIIASIFVNNYVLGQFLGICPTLGVTSKVETAKGMGAAVIFVVTLSSIITWIIQYYILDPLKIGYLQTVVFILVIASLVQTVEMIMKKSMPNLYEALGVYLPLITTNCIVLGVAIKNINESYNLLETTVNSAAAAVGFLIALVILASLREKIEDNDLPEAFKGGPITLITLGLMSIAFMGFAGLA
ncbi:MAG: electron transport complex subunit RsxA [Anaerococcus vaginalis]|nr:electron transport complex, RnfABCDGE type, A subunit [Anaerococcus hydrogenalis]MDU5912888.1 electron transport complex subunit RsxA [Anaerococcus vaginalis]MDU6063894.1 electron transport complex subunit RsxA [Anaerococcus sp.]